MREPGADAPPTPGADGAAPTAASGGSHHARPGRGRQSENAAQGHSGRNMCQKTETASLMLKIYSRGSALIAMKQAALLQKLFIKNYFKTDRLPVHYDTRSRSVNSKVQ